MFDIHPASPQTSGVSACYRHRSCSINLLSLPHVSPQIRQYFVAKGSSKYYIREPLCLIFYHLTYLPSFSLGSLCNQFR